jgi:hypothetical protein
VEKTSQHSIEFIKASMKNAYLDQVIEKMKKLASHLMADVQAYDEGRIPTVWEEASLKNKWFILPFIRYAIEHWAHLFSDEQSSRFWLERYDLPVSKRKRVLLILAGNIPLVGLHDVMCTLLAGHVAYIKMSSGDDVLLPYVLDLCKNVGLVHEDQILFKEEIGKDFDAVVATGSNLTANTFKYYFKDLPALIRGHRNSVAILTGKETKAELDGLADDIFLYFGLGCRNVSFLLVPENYMWETFHTSMLRYEHLMDHTPYAHNYYYYRGYFGMMLEKNILDKGFYLLRPYDQIHSPISMIHYFTYHSLEDALEFVKERSSVIQCVVASEAIISDTVPFGHTQKPGWDEYSDNLDTMQFLTTL